MTMVYVWIALVVILLVAEAATVQLTTVWFALGGLAALVAAALNAEIWVQVLLFVAVSAVALIATRPLVKKFTQKKIQPTNADRSIGARGTVLETISNVDGKGQVKVGGIVWTARTASDEVIAQDESVIVEAIDGVKLLVRRAD